MKSPQIDLADGTFALMHAIVQTANYRRGYVRPPIDAELELRQLAHQQIPPSWRPAPIVVLSAGRTELDEMFAQKSLPTVLSVGQFISYRGSERNPVYKYVAWVQEEFVPFMSESNSKLFSKIEWNTHI